MLPLFDQAQVPFSNGNGENIPKPIREFVLQRDGHKCRYCGRASEHLTIDHVYPQKYGGPTIPENLVAACSECNNQKGTKIGIWPPPIGYFEDTPKIIKFAMKQSIITYQIENTLAWYYRFRKISWYTGLLTLALTVFYMLTLLVNSDAATRFSNLYIFVVMPLFAVSMTSLPVAGLFGRKLSSLVKEVTSNLDIAV